MWKAEIERLENGFVVQFPNYTDNEGQEYNLKLVFEDDEEEFGRVESLGRVLWELVEYFGLLGSRYDKKRIRIELEPGDKYNDVKVN